MYSSFDHFPNAMHICSPYIVACTCTLFVVMCSPYTCRQQDACKSKARNLAFSYQ